MGIDDKSNILVIGAMDKWPDGADPDECVKLGSYLLLPDGIDLITQDRAQTMTTVQFRVRWWNPGGVIVFGTDTYYRDAAGNTQSALTITLREQDGQPYFDITPAWDGRVQ